MRGVKSGLNSIVSFTAQTLQRAVSLFQQGHLSQTEAICADILRANAKDFSALHLLGLVSLQKGQLAEATDRLRRSLTLNPHQPVAHLNLANVLLRSGKPHAALASCDAALAQRPDYAEALNNRGNALLELGRPADALQSYERALRSLPDLAPLHSNRGRALRDLGRHEEALESCNRALSLHPGLADALIGKADSLRALQRAAESMECCNQVLSNSPEDAEALRVRARVALDLREWELALADCERALKRDPANASILVERGNALFQMDRVTAALESYEQAIRLSPQDCEAIFNRGNALFRLERYEEALVCYDRVIGLQAGLAKAHYHRGNTLRRLGRTEDALASYTNALAIQPQYAAAAIGMGNAWRELDKPEQALACYDHALLAEPSQLEALSNRSLVLLTLSRPQEAAECLQRLLATDPAVAQEYNHTLGLLLHARLLSCDWRDHDSILQAIVTGINEGKRVSPPSFLPTSIDSPDTQLRCARIFMEDGWGSIKAPAWSRPHYDHQKIRLAYVSADYREHPVSMLMAGLFETHDRTRFEVIGVSLRPPDTSALGERVRKAFDNFVDVSARSDLEAASLMRELEVDIAVDLTGYTAHLRSGIFALRAAPVQVNYLGYAGTLAAPYMDYIIADDVVIPEESRAFYTEQVVYLPDCLLPHDDQRRISERTPSRLEVGLPENAFVFCCFNAHFKISPSMFDIWMRLLQSVEDSVLWLGMGTEAVVNNLRKEAAGRGVSPHRIVFAPRVPNLQDHLARYRLADLFLDTLPYNAHTTASDALWAGLPVLTCPGRSFASRVAASLLQAVGLPELIAPDARGYEELAVSLARDPAALAALRDRLARNRRTKPLFDTTRFRQELESAYITMWEKHRRGETPAGFHVDVRSRP